MATSVVLVWLHATEVAALASAEAVSAVELELDALKELVLGAGVEVVCGYLGVLVEAAGPVVEGVLAVSALDAPYELLNGVVEVKVDVGVLVLGGYAGGAVHLELLDEVLVALTGEAAALISVKVVVIYIEEALIDVNVGERTNASKASL